MAKLRGVKREPIQLLLLLELTHAQCEKKPGRKTALHELILFLWLPLGDKT